VTTHTGAHTGAHGASAAAGAVPPLTAFLLLVVAAAGIAGAAALLVLHRRGDRWPAGRTLAAAGALACLAAAALLPFLPGPGGFRGHVLVHLLVGMVAPLLLALAAPVTLALRVLPVRPRQALLAAVHSRPARVLTAPAAVLVLDVGALSALYLTDLHAQLHHSPVLEVAVHGHVLLAGLAFAVVVAGTDPLPSRPGTAGVLVLLVVAAAAHDVLATALHAQGLGGTAGPTADVRDGAALMRSGGHVVELALAAAVMTRWYRREGRALARERRRSDAVAASG
jgi:putative membrane protein